MTDHAHSCTCVGGCACGSSHGQEDAPGTILVTINPEARVSAQLPHAAPWADEPSEGTVDVEVTVTNEAPVRGELRVSLVAPPRGAEIRNESIVIGGESRQQHVIQLALGDLGLVDLTLAFELRGEKPDLAGRNRVHLLARGARAEEGFAGGVGAAC